MTRVTPFLAITLALTLSACASITLAPAGAYKVGSATVALDRNWSDLSPVMAGQPKHVRLLSIDGPLLNRLYLTDGLKPGDFIVRPARREATTPVYQADMSVTEQVEFVADSVTALDYQRVETSGLRPVEIAGERGVRFDIQAQTSEGLDIKGLGQAVRRGDRLYVAIYLAPAEHYFAASRASAEAVMDSLTF